MATFEDFYNSVLEIAKSYGEQDVLLKIDCEKESDLVKISGPRASPLARARNGLGDALELSYAVAEHHPYWNLLYRCSEISQTVLEKWTDNLTREELDEIIWSLEDLKNTCRKLQKSPD